MLVIPRISQSILDLHQRVGHIANNLLSVAWLKFLNQSFVIEDRVLEDLLHILLGDLGR